MPSVPDGAAIVTGSSSGIGRAIAERLAGDGANVVVNSRSQERAVEVAEEITDGVAAGGGTAIGVEADVTDRDAVQHLVDAAVDEFGRLDVIVNNAGANVIAPSADLDPADWQHVLDVTLTGTFYGAQAAGRQMIEQGTGGQIVNVSSMMGEQGLAERAAYTAAKGGVTNLTRTLAVEWADRGIFVNALAPGYVRTPMMEDAGEDADFSLDDVRRRTPLDRLGTVEEMATCVAFLVSGEHFVTGEVLHADGGWMPFAWGYRDE